MDEKALRRLVQLSNGDLRKSITQLQALSMSFETVSAGSVDEVCGRVPPRTMSAFWDAARSHYSRLVDRQAFLLARSGLSPTQFLEQLAEQVLAEDALSPLQKAELLDSVAVSAASLSAAEEGFRVKQLPSVVIPDTVFWGRCFEFGHIGSPLLSGGQRAHRGRHEFAFGHLPAGQRAPLRPL